MLEGDRTRQRETSCWCGFHELGHIGRVGRSAGSTECWAKRDCLDAIRDCEGSRDDKMANTTSSATSSPKSSFVHSSPPRRLPSNTPLARRTTILTARHRSDIGMDMYNSLPHFSLTANLEECKSTKRGCNTADLMMLVHPQIRRRPLHPALRLRLFREPTLCLFYPA